MAEVELDIEKRIYESASTLVHRGRLGDRPRHRQDAETRPPRARVRWRAITTNSPINQSLTSPYVVRAIELTEHDSRILFEDVRGDALRELIRQGNLTFEQKLAVSIQLCQALQSIHDEGVIHRDINPANVVCNPEDELVRLIDFGLATLAPREYPDATAIAHLTGTLPYISPEQTGRVNRVVDYRTDLYSLGATLYELFTGSPPFTNSDPLELIHYQIARLATPMKEVNPTLPQWLSDIVAKLLAETAGRPLSERGGRARRPRRRLRTVGEPRRHRELRARAHRRARAIVDSEAPVWPRRSDQDAEHAARSRGARRSGDRARARRPRHRQGRVHRSRAEQHRGTARTRGAHPPDRGSVRQRARTVARTGGGAGAAAVVAVERRRRSVHRAAEAPDQRQSRAARRARAGSRCDHRRRRRRRLDAVRSRRRTSAARAAARVQSDCRLRSPSSRPTGSIRTRLPSCCRSRCTAAICWC